MLLTKRGYQINKKLLTTEQLKEIQDDLLVTPKLNPPYDFDNQPINLLHQTINNIFIPIYMRFYYSIKVKYFNIQEYLRRYSNTLSIFNYIS